MLGENGCGKSTLIKILSGVEQPTEGQILKDGQTIRLHSPVDARRAGIATVFQEFSLVPDLSVAENIFLGRAFTTRAGLVDWPRIEEVDELTNPNLREVSFQVLTGEILGIAGGMGSGRTSLMRSLFGLDALQSGAMRLRGAAYAPSSPAADC